MSSNTRQSLFLAVAFAAVASIPGAQANDKCYNSSYYDSCDKVISNGAKIGVGLGIALIIGLVGFCLHTVRRKRVQKSNLAYINNPTHATLPGPYNPQAGNRASSGFVPQGGYNYNPNYMPGQSSNYAPNYPSSPTSPLPQYQPPVGSPPPTDTKSAHPTVEATDAPQYPPPTYSNV